jgi:hypothetical protein
MVTFLTTVVRINNWKDLRTLNKEGGTEAQLDLDFV